LLHQLGRRQNIKLAGFSVAIGHYPPVRRYYMCRNRLKLISEYALREPGWCLQRARRLLQEGLLTAAFESNRIEKFRAMAHGTWDFLRGRFGPYRDAA
jgi:hypothetical protein